jgi:hypothetical protein
MTDVAFICHACTALLTFELFRGALYASELPVTIAKMDRMATDGSGQATPNDGWEHGPLALEGRTLPVNLRAAANAKLISNTVRYWVRYIEITQPVRVRGYLTLPLTMLWLSGHLGWLRSQDEAVRAWGELHDAIQLAHRTVDAPPDRVLAGRCQCGAYLYGTHGHHAVRCADCGAVHDVAATRAMLRAQADSMLLTAAELATLAAYLDLSRDRERTRKLINQMSVRHIITPHGTFNGAPTYRCGDVLGKLCVRLSST